MLLLCKLLLNSKSDTLLPGRDVLSVACSLAAAACFWWAVWTGGVRVRGLGQGQLRKDAAVRTRMDGGCRSPPRVLSIDEIIRYYIHYCSFIATPAIIKMHS